MNYLLVGKDSFYSRCGVNVDWTRYWAVSSFVRPPPLQQCDAERRKARNCHHSLVCAKHCQALCLVQHSILGIDKCTPIYSHISVSIPCTPIYLYLSHALPYICIYPMHSHISVSIPCTPIYLYLSHILPYICVYPVYSDISVSIHIL